MKRLLNSLIAGVGLVALAPIVAPTDASAQSCRSGASYGHSRGYSQGHSRGYSNYRGHRNYSAHYSRGASRSVRVYVAPSRVITHPHYGGPIYYRNSGVYCAPRPQVRYRSTYVAPRRSYGYSSYNSPRRRCR